MKTSKAFELVFGAAAEGNKRAGNKITHPVTGEKVYEGQIRKGKTRKDRGES